jgi:hypothetical protein
LLELLLSVHYLLLPHRKFHNSYNSIYAAYATLINGTKPTSLVLMIINIV